MLPIQRLRSVAARLKAKRGRTRARFRSAAEEPDCAAPCQAGALPDGELLFTVGITKYPQGRAAFSVLQVRPCAALRHVLRAHAPAACLSQCDT